MTKYYNIQFSKENQPGFKCLNEGGEQIDLFWIPNGLYAPEECIESHREELCQMFDISKFSKEMCECWITSESEDNWCCHPINDELYPKLAELIKRETMCGPKALMPNALPTSWFKRNNIKEGDQVFMLIWKGDEKYSLKINCCQRQHRYNKYAFEEIYKNLDLNVQYTHA